MIEVPEGQMTTTQAAEFLGVSTGSVWSYVKRGLLKPTNGAAGQGVPQLLSIIAVKQLKAERDEGKGTAGKRPKKVTTAPPRDDEEAARYGAQRPASCGLRGSAALDPRRRGLRRAERHRGARAHPRRAGEGVAA